MRSPGEPDRLPSIEQPGLSRGKGVIRAPSTCHTRSICPPVCLLAARIVVVSGLAVAIAAPEGAQAANHRPGAGATTLKGQACGGLWIQQTQSPFATATLLQSSLEEVDGLTGAVVQSVGLCGGTWSQAQVDSVPVDHTTITYSKTFLFDGSRVAFSFSAAAFSQSTSVLYLGDQLVIPAGSVKYSFTISGWPFLNFDNTLQLSETLQLVGGTAKDLKNQRRTGCAAAECADRRQYDADRRFLATDGRRPWSADHVLLPQLRRPGLRSRAHAECRGRAVKTVPC